MCAFSKSNVAYKTESLRNEMVKLQVAIKRVGENWNDAVSYGIQSQHINNIVSTCNGINSVIVGLATQIEADFAKLEELRALSQSTATTGTI